MSPVLLVLLIHWKVSFVPHSLLGNKAARLLDHVSLRHQETPGSNIRIPIRLDMPRARLIGMETRCRAVNDQTGNRKQGQAAAAVRTIEWISRSGWL